MRVLIQGITGREGQRALEFMRRSGTDVPAGVTPGKGGQDVDGVPVFESIAEALDAVGPVDAVSMYVPARAVLPAAREAIEQGVPLIHILAEGMPARDKAELFARAEASGVSLLGPGSLGVLTLGEGRVGMVGGENPSATYKPGGTSIISRSGGMVNEIAHYLAQCGQGFRTMVHLGEEIVPGSTLIRELERLMGDQKTERVVIFDETTGPPASFRALASYASEKKLDKPVVMTLAGSSQSIMPAGIPFGHTEALAKKEGGELADIMNMLRGAGISVVDSYEHCI